MATPSGVEVLDNPSVEVASEQVTLDRSNLYVGFGVSPIIIRAPETRIIITEIAN